MGLQLSLSLPKQLVKSGTAVIYADQALVSGLNFLSSVLLARYLGLEGFGVEKGGEGVFFEVGDSGEDE